MDPRDFNRLAEHLARSKQASELRTSVSRSYYAVYHVAARLLRNMGFRISRGASGHAEVQMRLENCGDTQIERVGYDLHTFRGRRNVADYDLDDTHIEDAVLALAQARRAASIIAELESCSAEPRRSRIIAGINLYLEKLRP